MRFNVRVFPVVALILCIVVSGLYTHIDDLSRKASDQKVRSRKRDRDLQKHMLHSSSSSSEG